MKRTKFDLSSVEKLKGLPEEFDAMIKAATEDCLRRPGIAQKRSVTLVIDLTPNPNDSEQVIVKHHAKAKFPVRKGADYVMNTTIKNELTFQPESPMDPDQGNLFD